MSAVAAIIARLLEAGTPFAVVEGASDFAAIESRQPATPAAFVIVAEEAAAENERMTGPVLQRVEADIDVLIIDDNLTSARMGDAASDIEELKAFVRSRLIGFVPAGGSEPLSFVSGKLLRAKGGTIWHADTFGLTTYLEEQP